MPMSQEEMLARIAASARNRNQPSDLDPQVIEQLRKQRNQQGNNNPNLPMYAKPDPEMAANNQIDNSANRNVQAVPSAGNDSQSVQAMIKARMGNGINPETGMPFYNAPEALSPEQQKAKDDLELKTKYLQNLSKGQE